MSKLEVHFSSATDEWGTPDEIFLPLKGEFGMTLDVCATPGREKLAVYYSPVDDGLWKIWAHDARCAWMNPPYGREIGKWVRKAALEATSGAASSRSCPRALTPPGGTNT